MLTTATTIAAPSQRKFSGAPASATPRRASCQAAMLAAAYSTATASVDNTASSAKVPVSASTIAISAWQTIATCGTWVRGCTRPSAARQQAVAREGEQEARPAEQFDAHEPEHRHGRARQHQQPQRRD